MLTTRRARPRIARSLPDPGRNPPEAHVPVPPLPPILRPILSQVNWGPLNANGSRMPLTDRMLQEALLLPKLRA